MTERAQVITLIKREVYGQARYYVANEHGPAIKALTGRETVTESDIKALKALGFTFEAVQVSIPS